jgi:hypothetical protein
MTREGGFLNKILFGHRVGDLKIRKPQVYRDEVFFRLNEKFFLFMVSVVQVRLEMGPIYLP